MSGVLARAATLARIGVAARRARNGRDLRAREALASLLADARGVPMKVGQVMAGLRDDSPFRRLVEGVDALPRSEIVPAVERSLGRPLLEVFSRFDDEAVAASLGQVHHATLRDGTDVAVKVRYPGITDSVSSELRLAGLMPGIGPVKKWGFDIEGYKRVLRDDLQQELDYRGEARRQQEFARDVATRGLVVPRVFQEYCRDDILVQSWEHGRPFRDVLAWSKGQRAKIALTILETLLRSVFCSGTVHGDPHPGNSRYRIQDGRPVVVMLDFGCVVSIAPRVRQALLHLITNLREGRGTRAPLASWAALGFDPGKLRHIRSALPELGAIVFAPFLADGPFDLSTWHIKEPMTESLGDHRWWFRAAGPPSLLLVLRAFQGAVQQLERLEVSLPWWPLLERVVGDERLWEARAFVPPPIDGDHEQAGHDTATRLRVRISEQGREIAAFEFPARAALDLPAILPDEVAGKVRARGIDLQEAVGPVDDALTPRELFDVDITGRRYRVWLE